VSADRKDGGPAFPVDIRHVTRMHNGALIPEYTETCTGVSLRDYFAAKAMATMYVDDSNVHGAAHLAFKIADAMLKAREQVE